MRNTFDVLAVPYDTPQIGYHVTMWSITYGSSQRNSCYSAYFDLSNARKSEITEVLYPNGSNYEGRLLQC